MTNNFAEWLELEENTIISNRKDIADKIREQKNQYMRNVKLIQQLKARSPRQILQIMLRDSTGTKGPEEVKNDIRAWGFKVVEWCQQLEEFNKERTFLTNSQKEEAVGNPMDFINSLPKFTGDVVQDPKRHEFLTANVSDILQRLQKALEANLQHAHFKAERSAIMEPHREQEAMKAAQHDAEQERLLKAGKITAKTPYKPQRAFPGREEQQYGKPPDRRNWFLRTFLPDSSKEYYPGGQTTRRRIYKQDQL